MPKSARPGRLCKESGTIATGTAAVGIVASVAEDESTQVRVTTTHAALPIGQHTRDSVFGLLEEFLPLLPISGKTFSVIYTTGAWSAWWPMPKLWSRSSAETCATTQEKDEFPEALRQFPQ